MQARAQTSFSPALVGKRFPHPWPSLDELKEVNRGGINWFRRQVCPHLEINYHFDYVIQLTC